MIVQLVLGLSSIAGVLAAQAGPCGPSDSSSARFVRTLTQIATDLNVSAIRTREIMHLPQVERGEIVYVTDPKVCGRLLPIYNAQTVMTSVKTGAVLSHPSSWADVVRVRSVYVVSNPTVGVGEWGTAVVLDDSMRVLCTCAL